MITVGPAKILQSYLVARGLGFNPTATPVDWSVYRNKEPPSPPTRSITITDSGALKDGRMMRGGENTLHDSVQIRVRGENEDEARVKAANILADLQAMYRFPIMVDSVAIRMDNFSLSSPIMYIGQMEKFNMKVFTFSGNLTLSEA